VGLRAGLDDVENRKFLTLPGLELRPLGHARSQPPYRLRYNGSLYYDCIQTNSFIYSFIHHLLYSPLFGPGVFFSFVILFTQTAGLLGRVISPSQGLYPHTGQHKHRINAHTDIHALSGIRTHDLSVRASEDSSRLRPRGHRDRYTD
jgi:hypothetical protein